MNVLISIALFVLTLISLVCSLVRTLISMWPFSKEKDTKDVEKDLSPEVQQFFNKANPEQNQQLILEQTPKQQHVNNVLKNHTQYNQDLDEYRRKNRPSVVCSINCAELQDQVAKCFKNWKFLLTDPCRTEVNRARDCVELQTDALKRMYYDDCYLVKQCDAVRYLIDKAYVDNFGQYGDEGSEGSKEQFLKDLDKYFYKVWK